MLLFNKLEDKMKQDRDFIPSEYQTLPKTQKEELFAYIPQLEEHGNHETEDYLLGRIMQTFYDCGLVALNFEWKQWEEVPSLLKQLHSQDALDFTMDTWAKIITVLCRGDRFGYVSLEKELANGTLLKILHGIQRAV